jgi:hypothetical protein
MEILQKNVKENRRSAQCCCEIQGELRLSSEELESKEHGETRRSSQNANLARMAGFLVDKRFLV